MPKIIGLSSLFIYKRNEKFRGNVFNYIASGMMTSTPRIHYVTLINFLSVLVIYSSELTDGFWNNKTTLTSIRVTSFFSVYMHIIT